MEMLNPTSLCMFSLWAVGKQAGICGYFSRQERPGLVVTRVNPGTLEVEAGETGV